MEVHVPLLIFGLLLLWFPRSWLRLGRVVGGRRRRSSGPREPWKHERGDPRLSYDEFGKARNYFDLLRAAVGGLAIVGSSLVQPAIAAAEGASRGAVRQVLVAKLAILLVGLLIQTLRYERRHVSFFAAVFFVAGLSVALCGPWAALFAFMLVWAVNPMFGNAEAFLAVYAILLAGFGVLFRDTSRLLVIGAFGLTLLPVLLALLSRRPLVVFSRKAVHVAE